LKGDVVVYLRSGESIDISDLTPEDAIALLRSKGVMTDNDIERTVHRVKVPRC